RRFGALDGLQLQLEELLNHVQLAEIPIDAARLRERFEERRVQLVGILEVLEGFDAREKLLLEHATELQVKRGLLRILTGPRNAAFELFDQRLPVSNVLEIRKTLRLLHGSSVMGPMTPGPLRRRSANPELRPMPNANGIRLNAH